MRLVAGVLPGVLAACAGSLTALTSPPGVAPSPATPWERPPAFESPRPFPTAPAQLPPELSLEKLRAGGEVTLPEAVAIALANNPQTQDAWLRARSAAAGLDHELAAYLPVVSGAATFLHEQQAALGGQFHFEQTVADPSLALSFLLLDFGGRDARVVEAERTLAAADFAHDQAIEDVVLAAEQAYVGYVAQQALVSAEEAVVKSAQASVAAAQARQSAGLATRADVLQAATALANARLNFESVSGQLGIVKGSLATALGLPASVEVNVKVEPPRVPVHELNEKAQALIEEALVRRPDLAAARQRALSSAARVDELRAALLPSLSLDGSIDRVFFLARPGGTTSATNYSVTLDLQVPIFSGLSRLADIAQAKANAADARVQSTLADQSAQLQVWTSYFNLKTAARRTAAAQELLASATESDGVARGRYQEGLGTILDLLSAQSALANARGSLVQARAQWYLALAQLAHDVGTLSPKNVTSPLGPAVGGTP